jgi:hypothetical protein
MLQGKGAREAGAVACAAASHAAATGVGAGEVCCCMTFKDGRFSTPGELSNTCPICSPALINRLMCV